MDLLVCMNYRPTSCWCYRRCAFDQPILGVSYYDGAVQPRGDNDAAVEALRRDAINALRIAATKGTDVDAILREPALREAMRRAVQTANAHADVDDDLGRRQGACAALYLIQGASEIFEDPAKLPDTPRDLRGIGYLAGAASVLAETVAYRLNSAGAQAAKRVHWRARQHLNRTLAQVRQDFDDNQPRQTWWDTAFERIIAALKDYHLSEEDFQTRPQPVVEPYKTPAITPIEEGDDSNDSDPRPRRQPLRAVGNWLRLHWGQLKLVALTVAVTTVVLVVVAGAFPAIPRELFDLQAEEAQPEAPAGSPVIPPPPLPPRISEVQAPNALPNTNVRLFLMSDGANPVPTSQTLNGALPEVQAATVPSVYQRVTFQIWLSVREEKMDPDNKTNKLFVSIQVPPPMAVEQAMRMTDPSHKGEDADELETLPDGSGGGRVEIPPLIWGTEVIYQFDVIARPTETNSGYMCGYNPKYVQVQIQREGIDSRSAVVTPYPLYVARGENC